MEPSRDREENRQGGGSQRANKQIREGGEGLLVMETERMSKRWRMEIGLDRERRRGVAVLPRILGSGTWQRAC